MSTGFNTPPLPKFHRRCLSSRPSTHSFRSCTRRSLEQETGEKTELRHPDCRFPNLNMLSLFTPPVMEHAEAF